MESVYKLYSIFDGMAKRYGPLFEALNDEVAARQFVQMLDKVDKRFRKEYVLCNIGTFDFISGEIEGNSSPIEMNYVKYFENEEEIK